MTRPPSLADLRELLIGARELSPREEQMLAVAAVVEAAARRVGLRPVVSGGLAAWVWAPGPQVVTVDVDVIVHATPELESQLLALGFVEHDRHFVLLESRIFFEFPGSDLPPGWGSTEVIAKNGLPVTVVRPEDVVVDRMNQFLYWGVAEMGVQAVLILAAAKEVDEERLQQRAQEEGLERVLAELRVLAERAAGGSHVSNDELEKLATRLRREDP